jgi:hypothetical protein
VIIEIRDPKNHEKKSKTKKKFFFRKIFFDNFWQLFASKGSCLKKNFFDFGTPRRLLKFETQKIMKKKSKSKKNFFSSEKFFLIIFDAYWHQKEAV